MPSVSGCGISTSSTMMQWPRVDMGLNCVGAMALRWLALWNVSLKSSQLWMTRLEHHSMSMKPSGSLRMPFL